MPTDYTRPTLDLIPVDRRQVITGIASTAAFAALAAPARANVPVPYDWQATPPLDKRPDYIEWMVKNRGEDPGFLGKHWDCFQQLLARRDLWDERDKRAFLLTPREEFVTKPNLGRAYEGSYLPIGTNGILRLDQQPFLLTGAFINDGGQVACGTVRCWGEAKNPAGRHAPRLLTGRAGSVN